VFSASDQFITHMKLRELRAQREQSLAAYATLSRAAAQAHDDAARIRVLYDGLRNLRFAKQPLHPDVANLELILPDIAAGRASAETVTFWHAGLEQELAQGRLRAEVVYVFGALLEEWTAYSAEGTGPDPAQDQMHATLLADVARPARGGAYGALFDMLFTQLGLVGDTLATQTRKAVQDKVAVRLSTSELEGVLERIRDDVYRSAALRREAQRFLLNATLQKELADALSIQLDHLQEWDWPEDGVPARARWARTKWRLFLDEDLPTSCLLETLGDRWQRVFDNLLGQVQNERLRRLHRLLELGAPEVILQNERRMVAQSWGVHLTGGVDLWAETATAAAELSADAPLEEQLQYWGESSSIFEQRASMQNQLRGFEHFDGYQDEEQTGGMDPTLTLINAEITLARAAFPDRPLYVTKVDLRSYYPSLPHEVILNLLARFGLAPADLEFFRRCLRVRIQENDQGGAPPDGVRVLIQQTGVPNRRRLSDVLGELVLRLFDLYVQRSAKVLVVRLVDDICLLAASADEALKAWQAVERFCAACGLSVNQEKCGAVCIGDALPSGLPAAPPSWLLLALDAQGRWGVNEEAFATYLEQVRQELRETSSIISRIERYNAAVRYLKQAFALKVPLGASHRASVRDALMRLHYTFFDAPMSGAHVPGAVSIVDAVRAAIRERYLGAGAATQVPEAWVYWPITAGGLGLTQAVMLAASYAESYARRMPSTPPAERAADWQRKNNDWAAFYRTLLDQVAPEDPTPNKVMETLVSDFISRGAELTQGKQTSLSPYWRWVLYIYGPQLLREFGTFRFLFSELVPLQLVTQRGRLDSDGSADVDLDEGTAPGAGLDDLSF
jgi:hypothetical protein